MSDRRSEMSEMLEMPKMPKMIEIAATKVCYLAHPVSGDTAANVFAAQRWLTYLIESVPAMAFCCPWLPYLDVLDDNNAADRERGLRDSVAMAPLCHGIALCGGRISSGMKLELEQMRAHGRWVVDLTPYGALPPFAEHSDRSATLKMLQMSEMFAVAERRGGGS